MPTLTASKEDFLPHAANPEPDKTKKESYHTPFMSLI